MNYKKTQLTTQNPIFERHKTQRYTHVTAELSRHAADRMSEALWG